MAVRAVDRMAGVPAGRYLTPVMKNPNSLPLRSFLVRAAGLTALVTLAVPSVSAQAQVDPTPSVTTPAPVEPLPNDSNKFADTAPMPNRQAERFISKVSMLQAEQARLSAIAAQRAADDQVRTFADQVRTASNDRDQELNQLASSRSILLPTGKDANDFANENQRWQKKEGKDFDEDYVKRIIKLQKDSVDTLEDYAKDGNSDPELAAFAEKHLAALQESLRQAETLKKQLE